MDPDGEEFPLYADWVVAYRAGIEHHFVEIVTAVEEAFAEEMRRFDWFDWALVEQTVRRFVDDLDRAMDRKGLGLSDMYARRRARITADEEEWLRLGYEVTKHYMAGGHRTTYQVSGGNEPAFSLTVEHAGQVLLLNRGVREREGESRGFTLCGKCHRWLVGKNAEAKHVSRPTERGKCPRGAQKDDLLRSLWLTRSLQSDLALLDVPPPEGAGAISFYTTLLHTWQRALMVAFTLDENELEVRCQSDFECEVLAAIRDRSLPLPDEAQKVLYEGNEPIAIADFFYAPRTLVFVDGSPHYRDYVAAADDTKRRRLKAKGYRIVAVTDVEAGLDELRAKLGV